MLGMSSMMGSFAMSSLVDNILLMNFIELGDTFRLGLTVAKMRANPVNRATHECEVVDGQGMRVLPRQLPTVVPNSFHRLSRPDLARTRAPAAAASPNAAGRARIERSLEHDPVRLRPVETHAR